MKYLPVGTVVVLQSVDEENVAVLIIGRAIISPDEKLNDYLGVFYPYGFIDQKTTFYFSKEAIIDVIHVGYINVLELKVVAHIQEMKKQRIVEQKVNALIKEKSEPTK